MAEGGTLSISLQASDPDGDAITYEWSFGDGPDIDGDGIGDGATSTDMNPTYTYTSEGQYTVELIVTDANGAQTVYNPKVITVGEAPVVTINATWWPGTSTNRPNAPRVLTSRLHTP